MTKYIFWAHSIEGLLIDVEVMAINYQSAKRRIIKYIVLNSECKHVVRGIKPSVWE